MAFPRLGHGSDSRYPLQYLNMNILRRTFFTTLIIGLATVLGFLLFIKPENTVLEKETQQEEVSNIEEPKDVTLIAVGDMMLSRNVASKIKANNDFNYPFLATRDFLKTGDIVFGNLECPITPGREIKTGEFTFHADPGAEVALADAGFNILSLANNHTPNFGDKGLMDTFELLSKEGIKYVGAGKDAEDAERAVYMEKNGITFAFLAYNDSDVVPASYAATATRPGTNFMDIPKMEAAVKEAKHQADIIIVSMHSGTEYVDPNQRQINFAHAAIDAGADFIIGHHPHVLQRVEKYKDKYILYSLGNFIFDQMFSLETRQSVIVKAIFDKEGVKDITFTPVLIYDYAQPRIVENEEEKQMILKQLEL